MTLAESLAAGSAPKPLHDSTRMWVCPRGCVDPIPTYDRLYNHHITRSGQPKHLPYCATCTSPSSYYVGEWAGNWGRECDRWARDRLFDVVESISAVAPGLWMAWRLRCVGQPPPYPLCDLHGFVDGKLVTSMFDHPHLSRSGNGDTWWLGNTESACAEMPHGAIHLDNEDDQFLFSNIQAAMTFAEDFLRTRHEANSLVVRA